MQPGRSYVQPRGGRHAPQSHAAYAQQSQAQSQAVLAAQRQQQELEARRRERELSQRIARRPADRNIPEEVAQITIGDGVERYTKLRDMERRLDATIMQKRLDLMDPYRRRPEVDGKLRIWISNTADGQPWQLMEEGGSGLGEDGTFDFADSSQATYRVKIEARLLDDTFEDQSKPADGDAMETDAADATAKSTAAPRPKFSSFFRAIKIDFDRDPSLQPDGMSSIEWKQPAPNDPSKARGADGGGFDTLEFQRKGDEELNITISLYEDHQPPRYKLSEPLADLLDVSEADTAAVIAGIWDYVRALNLQEDDEHRRFICDARLKAIFSLDTIPFPQLREILLAQGHLTAPPPLQLPYTIRLDKAYISPPDPATPSEPTVYDVRVSLPSPLTASVRAITHSTEHLAALKALQELDFDLAQLVQGVNQGAQKHAFLTNLGRDPVGVVKRWVGSQRRDLEMVMAEGGRGYGEDGALPEAMRKGGEDGVWGSKEVREGVGVWLARARAH